MLLGGQVAPFLLPAAILASWPRTWTPAESATAATALAAAWLPRFAAVARFRQPILGAVLHPAGVALLVAIQWRAFIRNALGRPIQWKGRDYGSPGSETLPDRP